VSTGEPAISHTVPDTSTDGRATRWIGRIIDDRYRIVELIGEGGMGAVFAAEHLKLRKLVAVKTIRAEFAAHSQAEARFTREALATAQLDHPHIASAIDYGHLPEGGAYLVTQLVRGRSLARRLEDGPLSWLQACRLGSQVADALTAAHALGIVHRDLKPDNILLETRDDGLLHARVVDFGVARVSGEHGGAIADGSQPITRMGAVIGTPGYMAPEQAVGQQVDLRADLYALGVILWECCTGNTLWAGESLTELYARQLSQPAPSLRTAVPGDAPAALSALVDQLLARKPAERPASAAVVRDELRRLALTGEVHLTMNPPAATSGARPSPAPAGTPGARPALTPGESTLADAGPRTTAPSGVASPNVPAASAIPRAVRLSGLAVLVLLVVAVVVGTQVADRKRRAPPDPTSTKGQVSKAIPRKGRGPVDALVAEVPDAYADHARALLASDDPRERERAGDAIAGAPEADKAAIPEYLRNLAWFEHVPDCEDKKPILKKIADEGDARALPALKRIAAAPPGTCRAGFMRFECIECLRDELAEVIARFERADP
jgi:serine/threonine-protein kinase